MTDIAPPLSDPPVLEARELAFCRRDEPVFGPLDLRLHAGEVVLVEGDNGSGKTTLLRLLAGLLHIQSGQILLHGQPFDREHALGQLLYLGHQPGLKGDLSVHQNLRYSEGLYGRKQGASVLAAIEGTGLAGYEHEPVRQLSAGQRKRAALARLLLVPAAVWLLDEPWANLDRHGIGLVNRLLERHASAGGCALVTSHGTVDYIGRPVRRMELSA